MVRNLKAIGMAMAAALALSTVAASAASAGTHHFTVGSAPGIITAEGTEKIVLSITDGARTVECTNAVYEGTVSQTTNTEVTLRPTYSGCKVNGVSATVDVNHCAFVFKGATDENKHAQLAIECAAEHELAITYSLFGTSCVIHVPPQTPSKGVNYSQNGANIEIIPTPTEIKYTETGGGFCPVTTTGFNGTLSGTILARGFKEKTCSALTGTETTTPGEHFNTCEGAEQGVTLNMNIT